MPVGRHKTGFFFFFVFSQQQKWRMAHLLRMRSLEELAHGEEHLGHEVKGDGRGVRAALQQR